MRLPLASLLLLILLAAPFADELYDSCKMKCAESKPADEVEKCVNECTGASTATTTAAPATTSTSTVSAYAECKQKCSATKPADEVEKCVNECAGITTPVTTAATPAATPSLSTYDACKIKCEGDKDAEACVKSCSGSSTTTAPSQPAATATTTTTTPAESAYDVCKQKCQSEKEPETCVKINCLGGAATTTATTPAESAYDVCKLKCQNEPSPEDCLKKNCLPAATPTAITPAPVPTPAPTESDYAVCRKKCMLMKDAEDCIARECMGKKEPVPAAGGGGGAAPAPSYSEACLKKCAGEGEPLSCLKRCNAEEIAEKAVAGTGGESLSILVYVECKLKCIVSADSNACEKGCVADKILAGAGASSVNEMCKFMCTGTDNENECYDSCVKGISPQLVFEGCRKKCEGEPDQQLCGLRNCPGAFMASSTKALTPLAQARPAYAECQKKCEAEKEPEECVRIKCRPLLTPPEAAPTPTTPPTPAAPGAYAECKRKCRGDKEPEECVRQNCVVAPVPASTSMTEYEQCKLKCVEANKGDKGAEACVNEKCVQWRKTAVTVSTTTAVAISEDAAVSCIYAQCIGAGYDQASDAYVKCKEKCYASKYGEQNCREECEPEGKGGKLCRKLCNVEGTLPPTTLVSTPQPASTATSTQLVDRQGECISGCKKSAGKMGGAEGEKYLIGCKQNCMDTHRYELACKKACKKLADGSERCEEICPGATISVDDKPRMVMSVATTPDDKLWQCIVSNCPKEGEDQKGYASCKEKCYKLVFGEQNCKEECTTDKKGEKVCKKYCDVSAAQAAGAPKPTTIAVPTEKDPVVACVVEQCGKPESSDYPVCKEKCYRQYAPQPVAAALDVCASAATGSKLECMKMAKTAELKKRCAELKGEERAACEKDVRALLVSEDVGSYKAWLAGNANLSEAALSIGEKEKEGEKAKAGEKFSTKMAEHNKAADGEAKAALNKLEAFVKKADKRPEKLADAIERAEAKGHDAAELRYLNEKYAQQLNSAKELYAAGETDAALEALKQSDDVALAFKKTLGDVVSEDKAGLKHKASAVTPLANTIEGTG